MKTISLFCFLAGFLSIFGAIAVWFLAKEPDVAHGERFGIFIGLWAPTFFILSERVRLFAEGRPTNSLLKLDSERSV